MKKYIQPAILFINFNNEAIIMVVRWQTLEYSNRKTNRTSHQLKASGNKFLHIS